MALSDHFNKAKNVINTAAEGAAKMKDAIQQTASQKNEEQAKDGHAESGSGSVAISQTASASRAAATSPEAARETETSSTDGAPEITTDAFKAFLIAEGYKEYTDAGKPALFICTWTRWQTSAKPKKWTYPSWQPKSPPLSKNITKVAQRKKPAQKVMILL